MKPTEEERATAIRWLKQACACDDFYGDWNDDDQRATILAMLAERERMPHPDALSEYDLAAMADAEEGEASPMDACGHAYRALWDRYHPPAPPPRSGPSHRRKPMVDDQQTTTTKRTIMVAAYWPNEGYGGAVLCRTMTDAEREAQQMLDLGYPDVHIIETTETVRSFARAQQDPPA